MVTSKSNKYSAKAIFFTALDIADSEERSSFLDLACVDDDEMRGEVEQLLSAEMAANGKLLGQVVDQLNPQLANGGPLDATCDHVDVSSHPVVDRYKLLEEIGRGGMGTVYMAQQSEPIKRRVAIKLIIPGMDSREVLARFAAEQQALAMMDHPNIAKVLDAGTTEGGLPYFVMELVRGVPITKYWQQHRLELDERLRLFVEVCRAVQHAHQKGIIHRDIKPSNVMVSGSDGVPAIKVIDFGVAKALHHDLTDKTLVTQFSQFIGTPLYISPEQAGLGNLDVDTRSDIYSLGVLLYELLTGTTPFDRETLGKAGLEGARQIIREQEPLRPSSRLSTLNAADASTLNTGSPSESKRLAVRLRDELDWIVMKALEKDRTRRYDSASDLEQDIERYLSNAPVQACPPSRLYLAKKVMQRNRTLVALIAVATGGLLLSVGTLGFGLSRARIEQSRALAAAAQEKRARLSEAEQKQAAEASLTESEAVIEFLSRDLLMQASPGRQAEDGFEPDPNLTVRSALNRAADKIGDEFENRPRIEARLRYAIGDAFQNLGRVEQSLEQNKKAAALFRSLDGDLGSWTLSAEMGVAYDLMKLQRYDECIPRMEHLLAAYKETRAETDNDLMHVQQWLAESYMKTNQAKRAEKIAEASYRTGSAALGEDHLLTQVARNLLGQALESQGEYARATKIFEELYESVYQAKGPEDIQSQTLANNLATAYLRMDRVDDAIRLLKSTIRSRERTLGLDHPKTLQSQHNLGAALFNADRIDDALKVSEAVVKKASISLAATSEIRLLSELLLGRIYARLGRQEQAIDVFRNICTAYDKIGMPITKESLRPKYELADCLLEQGEFGKAIPLFRELVLDWRKVTLLPDDLIALDSANKLATAYWKNGDKDQAISVAEDVLVEMRARFPEDHPNVLKVRGNLAVYRVDLDHVKAGLTELEEVYGLSKDRSQGRNLASLYVKYGNRDKVISQVQENIQASRRDLQVGSTELTDELAVSSLHLVKNGDFELAEPVLREVLLVRKEQIPNHWKTYCAQSMLGGALLGQGHLDEAGPLLIESCQRLEKIQASIPGVGHERVTEAIERLVEFYEKKGEIGESSRWREKLLEFENAK